jgi:CHAT domain-containing protein/Tfp pilus assembly protein PilF
VASLQGQFAAGRQFYLASLSFARGHHDPWMESTALGALGKIAIQQGRYDDAVDWLSAARRIAERIGAKYQAENALGNLGSAYFELGDREKALVLIFDAQKRATERGDLRNQIRSLEAIGFVYQHEGDEARAEQSFHQTLDLARRIDSKDDIIYSLDDLAYAAIELGRLDEASTAIDELAPLAHTAGYRADTLYLMLLQGMLAAAKRQDKQAEEFFHAVEKDPAGQIPTRLQAGLELARLFEREGRAGAAESAYKAELIAFESARDQLRNEDSRLPFMANAVQLYDGYIHLLVEQGRVEEALTIADQSRAQTLAEDLGLVKGKRRFKQAALHPGQIAQKTGATLLFYWLGDKQSYLWAVTPRKTEFYPLPARAELASRVERYRKALLEAQNPLEAGALNVGNQDGRALYAMLVAPAARLIHAHAQVIILADGALSQLNFETLLAPGPVPSSVSSPTSFSDPSAAAGLSASSAAHYWIEDATILSAPSLSMLAAAKPESKARGNLLLMGNALPNGEDYPRLPMAEMEMKLIEQHFAASGQTVLAGSQATPVAYLASSPEKFSYLHFVAHGFASSTDPLDSAIILSRSTAADDSFKLYAREILQHPIDARLVTISSCYGSGTRTYAGEGLVGLSWAFLRAGAHNVIGALWEVSDNSTPRLMDNLYQGLETGQSPGAALRAAKLSLLHSSGNFQAPFFWASFQIYTWH